MKMKKFLRYSITACLQNQIILIYLKYVKMFLLCIFMLVPLSVRQWIFPQMSHLENLAHALK